MHSEACFFFAQVACLHEHDLHSPLQLYSSERAEHGLGNATQIVAVSTSSKIPIHALDFSLPLESTQGRSQAVKQFASSLNLGDRAKKGAALRS